MFWEKTHRNFGKKRLVHLGKYLEIHLKSPFCCLLRCFFFCNYYTEDEKAGGKGEWWCLWGTRSLWELRFQQVHPPETGSDSTCGTPTCPAQIRCQGCQAQPHSEPRILWFLHHQRVSVDQVNPQRIILQISVSTCRPLLVPQDMIHLTFSSITGPRIVGLPQSYSNPHEDLNPDGPLHHG